MCMDRPGCDVQCQLGLSDPHLGNGGNDGPCLMIMAFPVRLDTLLPLPLLSFWFIFSSYCANQRLDKLRKNSLSLERGQESEVVEKWGRHLY